MAVLSDRARKKRNEYMREYRKRNPDKIREINARYWENKAKKEEGSDNE